MRAGASGASRRCSSASRASRTWSPGTQAASRRPRITKWSAPGARATPSRSQITYDPSQISYGKLLQVFFSVAHDPTQLNRQGPDEGTQYRSAIFYASDEQKRVAEAYIQQLNQAKVFKQPIVTQVTPLQGFYAAEDYHQDYIAHNPGNPYVIYNDLPKLASSRRSTPTCLKKR